MTPLASEHVRLHRVDLEEGSKQEIEDVVAADEAICIFINGEFYRTMIATPGMTRELVLGHLYTEGVIGSMDDVAELKALPLKVQVELKGEVDFELLNMSKVDLITTACGSLSTPLNAGQLEALQVSSDVQVEAEAVWRMVRELNLRGERYKETGGTHSAMLCTVDGEVVSFAEDVGRHNAVDKVVGAALLEGVELGECALVSSGRQSSEMVLKAARSGVPVVVSVAAPLTSGIQVARSTGITLVCFVRGRRMNVYSHPERVKL
ncbi:formate dehydrogenase accessory sulfurtransferase FdhD [Candidatus Bathyarchaeota archaeon]|nr:formate dehydrogenase accessory sulfurtransferase FdhD [Candidatus Bathyarchaeota archaeon]